MSNVIKAYTYQAEYANHVLLNAKLAIQLLLKNAYPAHLINFYHQKDVLLVIQTV